MVCVKCDRCGETYDFYGRRENDELCTNAIVMSSVYTDEGFEETNEFYLCLDCMGSFNRWMKNPAKDLDENTTNEEDAKVESFFEQTESSLKETFVSVYDVWGMVADVIIRCTESINNMDKERKRNG